MIYARGWYLSVKFAFSASFGIGSYFDLLDSFIILFIESFSLAITTKLPLNQGIANLSLEEVNQTYSMS